MERSSRQIIELTNYQDCRIDDLGEVPRSVISAKCETSVGGQVVRRLVCECLRKSAVDGKHVLTLRSARKLPISRLTGNG